MAFDGLVTRGIVNSLRDKILYGKVDKIYQPEKSELVFQIHTDNGKVKLYISCDTGHPGLFLTDESFQNPETPSGFCMLLRKHLQGSRIIDVKQVEWERIAEICFETRDELGFNVTRKIIVEIMGKHSNIVFADDDSLRILDSVKRISFDVNRARQILPGLTYEYPPSQNKTSPEDVTPEMFESFTSPKDVLSSIQGICPAISRELFDAEDGYQLLQTYLRRLDSRDFENTVYIKDAPVPFEFHILPLTEYNNMEQKHFDTVSNTIEYFYKHRESSNRVKQKASDLTRYIHGLLKKAYHKKQNLLEDILQAEKADDYRLYGELLTANLHMLKQGDKKVKVLNYYDNKEIEIPLDPRFSPSKNAQIYYKRYNKAKTAIVEKQTQIENTNTDIEYLESVLGFIELADQTQTVDDIREELTQAGYLRRKKHHQRRKRKNSGIAPYEYHTSEGFRVLVGRNNVENDALTLKKAARTDIWFHTKEIHGSHAILFTEGREVTDLAIFETASIAAYHSKGRLSENVPVDYTLVKYVKKPSGAKPGMVIFTDNKTVYVTPKLPQ